MSRHPLLEGVACALGAGLVWGLVFVAPLMLADYPPAMLSFGRYLAFGIIALPLALRDLHRLRELTRADWSAAFELALTGNIVYYFCLSASIQLADAPLPTMLIGTLPVVIAIASNLHENTLPWRRLAPSLLVVALGIALVNRNELAHLDARRSVVDYALGVLLGLCAVAAWTWYPMRNSRWMKLRPQLASGAWATAQGLATLPLAAVGMILTGFWYAAPSDRGGFDFPLGPRPASFIGLMLVIGLCSSWLGTLLWNRASKLLPTALAGQLIVFETLAALAYAFLWRGAVPGADTLIGIVLLVVGVMLGMRAFHQRR
ncbi:MAG: DMT family transporter [Betaproteobacteria bacterium]|nr:DMT family transporter [Betaproteobacteria bacterium]